MGSWRRTGAVGFTADGMGGWVSVVSLCGLVSRRSVAGVSVDFGGTSAVLLKFTRKMPDASDTSSIYRKNPFSVATLLEEKNNQQFKILDIFTLGWWDYVGFHYSSLSVEVRRICLRGSTKKHDPCWEKALSSRWCILPSVWHECPKFVSIAFLSASKFQD